jgi:hypothetical protein
MRHPGGLLFNNAGCRIHISISNEEHSIQWILKPFLAERQDDFFKVLIEYLTHGAVYSRSTAEDTFPAG